ncbi:MAG: cyclic dehypoxanthinyl futalosine synthase [Planctomycetia bacterium]|nr:cyclic dehypoxanthinyl futalosine synthase [Planctomycetia bacterium]
MVERIRMNDGTKNLTQDLTQNSIQNSAQNSALCKTLDETAHSATRRLTPSEAVELLRSSDLAQLGLAAQAVSARLHPEKFRTYNIDRNINYTNVCECRCKFCGFSCDIDDPKAYVISIDEMFRKIEETLELGGRQILLQGGLHPELRLVWFENMFLEIKKKFPQINIHGLTPTEIWYLARMEGISFEEVICRLKLAGLGSLPGGGAEILVDEVRKSVSPKKIMTDDWLHIMRLWHQAGGRSTATMMFGHVETLEQRVEHLDRIRQLQDETAGFTAFIPWTYQRFHDLPLPKTGAFEYLKNLAVARIFLDNIPNIQTSWVTQGLAIGQLALRFGANDMGSVMIEENVVASCGTVFRANENELRNAIEKSGFQPKKRNVFYELEDAAELL